MFESITSKLLKVVDRIISARNILKNRIFLSLTTVFITITGIFLLTGVLYFRNEVVITDGEKSFFAYTMLDDPDAILKEQGIMLENYDYYDFSGFINETADIIIHRTDTVSISLESVKKNYLFRNGDTVENILRRENIVTDELDIITPNLSEVCSNGDSIEITRAISVNLSVDGEKNPIKAKLNDTVKDILKRTDINIGKDDIINCLVDDVIYPDMEIIINRVKYIDKINVTSIPYETIEKNSILYPIGTKEVVTEGINGAERTITREKLIDGVVADSVFISSEITSEPINEIIALGTALKTPYSKREFDEITLKNGLPENYQYIVSGKSCAYTAKEGSGTASGRKLQIGTIAVDPNVIPYGSLLYIVSQDGKTVYGSAVAADTGYFTDVVADVYMGTTAEHYNDACNWGAKWVDIYVINTGLY